jgi:hypothetical protein
MDFTTTSVTTPLRNFPGESLSICIYISQDLSWRDHIYQTIAKVHSLQLNRILATKSQKFIWLVIECTSSVWDLTTSNIDDQATRTCTTPGSQTCHRKLPIKGSWMCYQHV